MFKIFIHPTADKELDRIPRDFRLAILDSIGKLQPLTHPLQHPQVVKMRERKTKDFRLREGNYRVEFTLENGNTLKVTEVKHRQAGY